MKEERKYFIIGLGITVGETLLKIGKVCLFGACMVLMIMMIGLSNKKTTIHYTDEENGVKYNWVVEETYWKWSGKTFDVTYTDLETGLDLNGKERRIARKIVEER